MGVINSFIAQLKLSAQPVSGGAEQIANITDTEVSLRTVGTVPNDVTGVLFRVSAATPSDATVSINGSIPIGRTEAIRFGYVPGNESALQDLITGLVTNPTLVASAGGNITVDVTYYTRDISPITGGPILSLVSASVEDANPDQIVLAFSSALDGGSVPATTDFTASGGKTINNVAIAGSAITLTVDSAYINSDTITVSHTPGGNPITGTNTATAGAFSNFAVTNNIAGVTDTTAPTAVLVGVLPTATTGSPATITVDFDDETAFNPASVTIGSLSAVDGANVATIAIANTTTISNNGVRVDFDVIAPEADTYTVTVPANSYADAAGNQGSLVNLGSMIVRNPIQFPSLTASNTLNYIMTGQSNAENSITNGLLAETQAQTPATVILLESVQGGTGFRNGDLLGEWVPKKDLTRGLIAAINRAKVSADSNTVFSPVFWWQIEADSTIQSNVDNYKDQFLFFKSYVERKTATRLNWIFFRLSVGSNLGLATEARAVIDEIAAENSDIALVDIDDFTPFDGLHYLDAEYQTMNARARGLADTNLFYKTLSEASFTYTPPAATGVIYDLTVSGAPGGAISSLTPATGNPPTADAGSFVISAGGNGIVASGASPGAAGWLLDFPALDTSPVTRVDVSLFNSSNTETVGVVVRKKSSNEFVAIRVKNAATGTVEFVSFINSFTVKNSFDLATAGDNLFNLILEFDETEIRFSLNGSNVSRIANAQHPFNKEIGLSFSSVGTEIRSIAVTGQANFVLGVFQPDVNTIAWYDPSDVTTITTSTGNSVSQLADKSGNSNHMSFATQSQQPVSTVDPGIVLNRLDFDHISEQTLENTSFSFPATFAIISRYVVRGFLGPFTGSGVYSFTGGSTNTFELRSGDPTRFLGFLTSNAGGNFAEVPADGSNLIDKVGVYSQVFDFAVNTVSNRINGITVASRTYSTALTDTGTFAIGQFNQRYTTVELSEMIITSDLSQVESIENYLAWKWV